MDSRLREQIEESIKLMHLSNLERNLIIQMCEAVYASGKADGAKDVSMLLERIQKAN